MYMKRTVRFVSKQSQLLASILKDQGTNNDTTVKWTINVVIFSLSKLIKNTFVCLTICLSLGIFFFEGNFTELY